MPRYAPAPLPDGWQAVRREDGWWLQRRGLSSGGRAVWSDYSGPYTQRGGAVRRVTREVRKQNGNHEEC